MLKELLFAIWFFLPAGIANAAPVFSAKIKALHKYAYPMDFHKTYRDIRIFGSHKTWRGFISGVIMATVVLGLQQLMVIHFAWAHSFTAHVKYEHLPTLILGPLFAIGALGGDAIESFFKRQRKIPPGHGWFPFDQTDYIIGGAIATSPLVQLSVREYALLIVFWFVAQLITVYIGWLIGLRERPI